MNINRYNNIVKKDTNFNPVKIKQFIAEPKDIDYKRGYIVRYFVQKINDTTAPIYEVDQFGYDKFSNNTFYKTVSIDWRLTGTDEQIKDSNQKSIMLGAKKIKSLGLYLPNLLQFKKVDE